MISPMDHWRERLLVFACRLEGVGATVDPTALGIADLYGLYLWLLRHGR